MTLFADGRNDNAARRFLAGAGTYIAVAALVVAGLGAPALAAGSDEVPAIGGPVGRYVAAADAVAASEDQQYQALFTQWKSLDGMAQGAIAVPSSKPVDAGTFTSGFGVRSDPFRGGAAMHAGVDLAAPIGTPIYATADGIVGRAGWSGGYGNLVELEHGRGLATRYGHLSQILVHPGQRVRRGELIAKMGSTGRSTGSHLHYEVRIDGHAVNPVPYLESANYLAAFQKRTPQTTQVAVGGPEDPGE